MSTGIAYTAYIAARAPNYVSDARVGAMALQAAQEIGIAFGNLQGKATALLILHWLAMDDRAAQQNGNSIGGTIAGEREGSLERRYMIDFSLTKAYPDLSQTRWGMELIQTRKSAIVTAPFNRFTTVPPAEIPTEQVDGLHW